MNNRVRSVFSGILLIALAVALVLWKLGMLSFKFTFWGVSWFWGVVAIFLAIFAVSSLLELNFGGFFFASAVICIIFAKPWHLTAITPWVVLIVAALLTAAFDNFFPFRSDKKSFLINRNGYESDGHHAYFALRMGESAKYYRSESLENVDLSLTMGEMSVYFDGVTVPNGVINIHTRTSLGETQIFVPKDWKIVNNVRVTAGDVTFKGLPDESGEGSIECVVDGNVFCGNLEINRI